MSDPSPLDKEARLDLGPVQAIPPGQGRCFRIGSSAIAVFRLRDGALRALDAHCPHQGGLLSDGLVDNEKVLCPLHALAFSLHTGAGLHHSLRVSRYKAADCGGRILLELPCFPPSEAPPSSGFRRPSAGPPPSSDVTPNRAKESS